MTMRILQILAPGRAELVEKEPPSPGRDEVLVRVDAVSACSHWDMTLMAGVDIFDRPGFPQYPLPPGREGHEMCGIVEAVGQGVAQFRPGQRVAAWRTMGAGRWGYYAEYAALSADDLLSVPPGMPDEAIAPLELAMCVSVCFLDMPDVKGLRFSVGGLGAAGLVAVQMARAAAAAQVIGFDPVPERRRLAERLGADRCLDPASAEAMALREQPRGARVDAAIDCSGAKASVQCQMDMAGRWVSVFGVQHETYEYTLRHRGLTLYGYGAHRREAAEYAMDRIKDGRVQLSPLISREMPLSEFARGTELLGRKKAIKVLYRP